MTDANDSPLAVDTLLSNLARLKRTGARLRGQGERRVIDVPLRIITPMLGGGAMSGVPDSVQPIRASSVRAQIQFWWRATVDLPEGPQAHTELLRKQRARWGGVHGDEPSRSQIDVEVEVDESSLRVAQLADVGSLAKQHDDLTYVLWMALKQEYRKPGLEFTLRLRYPPAVERELIAAVRAWVLFGGYGSRTRRGFGSLETREVVEWGGEQLIGTPGDVKANLEDLQSRQPTLLQGGLPRVSGGAFYLKIGLFDAMGAWVAVVRAMKRFRTSDDRDEAWPEQFAYQRLINRTLPRDGARWARAGFGMPLKYKTKGGEFTVKPALDRGTSDRLPSAYIIKPVAQWMKGSPKYFPAVFKLRRDDRGLKARVSTRGRSAESVLGEVSVGGGVDELHQEFRQFLLDGRDELLDGEDEVTEDRRLWMALP